MAQSQRTDAAVHIVCVSVATPASRAFVRLWCECVLDCFVWLQFYNMCVACKSHAVEKAMVLFVFAFPQIKHTDSLSNIFHIHPVEQSKDQSVSHPEIVLGHMSRLSCEKGVGTCLEVYQKLKGQGIPVVLRLAGRFADAKTRDLVQTAASNDASIQHLGEISGDDKSEFFRSLSYFLFPSAYRNETQGIVNLEALSYSVPVLAVGRACLKSDLSRQPEWLFLDQEVFADQVPSYIAKNLEQYPELRKNAAELFKDLKSESRDQLKRISGLLVPLEA